MSAIAHIITLYDYNGDNQYNFAFGSSSCQQRLTTKPVYVGYSDIIHPSILIRFISNDNKHIIKWMTESVANISMLGCSINCKSHKREKNKEWWLVCRDTPRANARRTSPSIFCSLHFFPFFIFFTAVWVLSVVKPWDSAKFKTRKFGQVSSWNTVKMAWKQTFGNERTQQ